MNSLLKVASELDKCGQYELSDKLFSIAQRKAPPSLRRTPNPPGVISNQELPDPQADAYARKYPLTGKTVRQIAKSSDPFVDALIKDAPPELIKEIYSFGIEKLESKEGLQSFIGLATSKFGKSFSGLINKIKSKFTAKPMSAAPNKANKVLSLASNPAFEAFLHLTNKLSPNAKMSLRSLMQSTGKNLQSISKSLEGFAGSPQAQLVEPAIEIAFSEFGKYLDDPQGYKSSMSINTKAVEQSINPYKAWQDLILKYYATLKTPQAVLAAFQKNNPTISIQVPNFAQGQIFNQPLNMGSQTSKPFNQLDPSVKQNIIYMINNKGALPPSSTTPIMSPGESNRLRNQQ
jgi:hypothetical protein